MQMKRVPELYKSGVFDKNKWTTRSKHIIKTDD